MSCGVSRDTTAIALTVGIEPPAHLFEVSYIVKNIISAHTSIKASCPPAPLGIPCSCAYSGADEAPKSLSVSAALSLVRRGSAAGVDICIAYTYYIISSLRHGIVLARSARDLLQRRR